jgi:hypothetical protein
MDGPISTSERPKALDVWRYELQMLAFAIEELTVVERYTVEQYAMLEVFLLHARNLTEFYLDDPRKDDIVAMHIAGTDWLENSGLQAQLDELRDGRETIHKWLAHITATRIRDPKNPDYNVGEMATALFDLTYHFVSSLEPETRDDLPDPFIGGTYDYLIFGSSR